MNKTDQLMVEILQKCYSTISKRQELFICYAVTRAVRDIKEEYVVPVSRRRGGAFAHPASGTLQALSAQFRAIDNAGKRLKRYIIRVLQGTVYYDNWLYTRSANYRALLSVQRRRSATRAGRLAWINHMIQEIQNG